MTITTTTPPRHAAAQAAEPPDTAESPAGMNGGRGGASAGKRPLPPAATVAVQMLAATAVLALWAVIYLVVVAPVQQDRAQQVLHDTLREQVGLATVPIGGLISPGTPVALLEIPGLDLSEVVVEGTASADLQSGPGHRRDTALPGQRGVSVIYGRASTFGAPFGQITALHEGDRISAVTGQGVFEYRVDGVRRSGDPIPPPPEPDSARLTLVTAEGDGRFGMIAADETVYVDATLVDPAQPAPPDRPSIIPPAEQAMEGDSSGLFPLVLWLQALAAAGGAFVWARARWGRWETWIVGAPIILALTWRVTETAALLLPNLL